MFRRMALALVAAVALPMAVACGEQDDSPAAASTPAPVTAAAPVTTAAPATAAAMAPTEAPPPAPTVAPQTPQAAESPARTAVPTAKAEEAPRAATAEAARPTLKAGVVWLDSPLDPVQGGWVASQSGMSENLFRLSPTDFSPTPWLAMEAADVNPLTWRIKLRSGVTFHNGSVMNAEAVKASLERTIRLSEASASALGIESIAVSDEETITITTAEPRPTLPGLLSGPAVAITDAAAADAGVGRHAQRRPPAPANRAAAPVASGSGDLCGGVGV